MDRISKDFRAALRRHIEPPAGGGARASHAEPSQDSSPPAVGGFFGRVGGVVSGEVPGQPRMLAHESRQRDLSQTFIGDHALTKSVRRFDFWWTVTKWVVAFAIMVTGFGLAALAVEMAQ